MAVELTKAAVAGAVQKKKNVDANEGYFRYIIKKKI